MNTNYRSICKASFAVLLASAMGVVPACAQHRQSLAKATVPFAFQYGSRTFPAGRYSFGMISDNIMAVRGPGNSAVQLVNWDDVATPKQTGRLVFRHYGNDLVLQDIWVPELSAHLHFAGPKQPRHREVAETKPAGPEVEVALLEDVR